MNTKLTPHQAGHLRRCARFLSLRDGHRVVAVSKATVPHPAGATALGIVGSAGALEHLARKGYLARETVTNVSYVEQRYYRLTDQGAAWYERDLVRQARAERDRDAATAALAALSSSPEGRAVARAAVKALTS